MKRITIFRRPARTILVTNEKNGNIVSYQFKEELNKAEIKHLSINCVGVWRVKYKS